MNNGGIISVILAGIKAGDFGWELNRWSQYSPELNPSERLWEEVREKEFASRVFDSLGAAIARTARGMKRLEDMPDFLRSLTVGNGY